VASRYLSEINNPKIKLPTYTGTKNHVFHLFVVQVVNRNEFVKHLKAQGIGTLIHYPKAPHKQKALAQLGALSFPVTERLHEQVVSIPIGPTMTSDQVNRIIEVLNTY
jgi:dTDP-4-amino-4,6-dideoxygalactose transaminase